MSGSNKSTTSRYVPVASQLSLSRPQCSFVHIDGVQCGAITWNKYVTVAVQFLKQIILDATKDYILKRLLTSSIPQKSK